MCICFYSKRFQHFSSTSDLEDGESPPGRQNGCRICWRPQCKMLSVVGATRQQGICLWCALPVPSCSSTGGMSNLDKFWSFKSIPFLSQCGLCPVYFLEILPPHTDELSHGSAVSSGAQSESDVLTRRYKDAQSGLPWWRGGRWLRIRLPMQGTRVRSLVREDPTCDGATKPLRATTTEPTGLEPVLRSKRSHRNEKPAHHNEE